MSPARVVPALLCLFTVAAFSQQSKEPKGCEAFHIQQGDHNPFKTVATPQPAGCHTQKAANGYPVPDPHCTPGAVNPSVTEAILKNPAFRTGCIRDQATSESDKASTYAWYSIAHPSNNSGENQTCELDHFVPLYLGGADTLDNIWPQCGPTGKPLADRYFKEKDRVEYYLGQQVRMRNMALADAQKGIATDWTKYLKDAEAFCASGKCDFAGQ